MAVVETPDDAIQLLASLGASAHLVRHHELVLEAAVVLCDQTALTVPDAPFDRKQVLLGAALHDAGKIAFPGEMTGPGREHEAAGKELVCAAGVEEQVARHCVTHARWAEHPDDIEVLLVAAADKLWKGHRVEDLETLLRTYLAEQSGRGAWDLFVALDTVFEHVADGGPDRLARSTAW